nr:MAG TPA: hypothetical protein [Caudoviricetes sp.]
MRIGLINAATSPPGPVIYYSLQFSFAKIIIFLQKVIDNNIIVCYNHRQLRDTRSQEIN